MKKKTRKIVELEIESIGNDGVAVAKKDGLVYFVKNAVPGDVVEAEVIKKKKKYYLTQTKNIIKPSADRIDSICNYFGTCGGCSWQNLTYDKQLFWKARNVKDAFERIGNIEGIEYRDIIPAVNQYHYRNKMEYSFGWSRWMTQDEIDSENVIDNKDFALGLHVPGRFDKVIDIERCYIQPDICNKLVSIIRDKSFELGVTAHNQIKHEGFLKNLVMRSGLAESDYMCILITTSPKKPEEEEFLSWFENEFPLLMPEYNEIIHAVNDTKSPVATGEVKIIKGRGYFVERILDLDYIVSPFSFFQTNSSQLNRFISEIIDFANLKKEDTVWDFYCGTGSITLPASGKCKQIIGIELVESSINDAKKNASINNIDNAQFHCADLHDKDTPELLQTMDKPDVVILDPPRAGIHKNLLAHLLEVAAPKIVYVSCNPSTQARDCAILSEKYDVKMVRPVDMFPQTYHIESIALLELKASDNA